ncbi:MAG: selenide, water dikinase SelD, partial [Spirochaetia bacterium]|nr:selenide, water dikinase SelD [Spirochaetia bacterium]
MSEVKLTQMVKTSGCAAKLPPKALHQVLDSLPIMHSPDLVEGYEGSDDAFVYKIPTSKNMVMLQTVDFFPPMVDDPYLFGQVAAANALSDIYAMGGEPKIALNLVCFPGCLELSVLREILLGGQSKVAQAGAIIAGGHTINDPTPKYGLCVTGFVDKSKVWTNTTAKVGDVLILTKPLGVGIINTAVKAGLASENAAKKAINSMTMLNKYAHDCALPY